MANAFKVEVYPKLPSVAGAFARQALFWVVLLGVTGVSRMWFGGAFIVDLAAFMLAALWVVSVGMKLSGSVVTLDREQAAEWVNSGMPADVKTWKANRYG